MSEPYREKFAVGSKVRVRSQAELERFAREWRFHNPLKAEQLSYAGVRSIVMAVGFYHGGAPLYQLENIPGVWHEQCLEAP